MILSKFLGSFDCSEILLLGVPSMFFHHNYKIAIVSPSLMCSQVSIQHREEGKEGELFPTNCSLISEDHLLQKTQQLFLHLLPPPYERLGNRVSGYSESSSWRNGKTSKKKEGSQSHWQAANSACRIC